MRVEHARHFGRLCRFFIVPTRDFGSLRKKSYQRVTKVADCSGWQTAAGPFCWRGTQLRGWEMQPGSFAQGSPVTAYARAREPPQISLYSQAPHLPSRRLVSRKALNMGALR